MESLIKEIRLWREALKEYRIISIFMGGGTPTIVSPGEMDKLLNALYKYLELSYVEEFTIEGNPGTINNEKVKLYLESGINRLSLGLQAWQESLLKNLGRIHGRKDFLDNFFLAREMGFHNINIDIMFGLPGQGFKDWKETLEKIVVLKPEHLSTYSLKLEEGTKFFQLDKAGELSFPSEELDRRMYHYTIDFLTSNCYSHYEISNFAIRGKECIHNKVYWNNEEYIGLGLGAHSYQNRVRFSNVGNLYTYINRLENNRSLRGSEEKTSIKDEIEETMFLGLRMIEGIELEKFKKRFGVTVYEVYPKKIRELQNKGLIAADNRAIYLTEKGYDLSNLVFSEFLLDENERI